MHSQKQFADLLDEITDIRNASGALRDDDPAKVESRLANLEQIAQRLAHIEHIVQRPLLALVEAKQ
jgi:hypothetical protein